MCFVQLKDDDDKEGMGGLTAPRSLVIRLEESTKTVQKNDRVLAVFPDTTSFYLGVVHRVSGVSRTGGWVYWWDALPSFVWARRRRGGRFDFGNYHVIVG